MSRLHDELARIAEHAPDVDLTDRVLRAARRRRAGFASAAAALAVTVVAAITLTVIGAAPNGMGPIAGEPAAAPGKGELPVKGVSPAAYAYYDWCGQEIASGTSHLSGRDCLQWRLVTRTGERYRVPEAMGPHAGPADDDYVLTAPPVRITADGRKIAYYSEKEQRFAVRDLESGSIRLAPPFVPAADVRRNLPDIALSPDGRYLAISVPGSLNTLADLETGELTDVPAGWSVRSIGAGGRPVVVAGTMRLGLLSGGEVRPFTGTAWHTPGGPGPDGTTLAYLNRPLPEDGGSTGSAVDAEIVTVDAVTGESRTRTPVRDVPLALFPLSMGPWLDATEVTVLGRRLDARPVEGDAKVLGWDTYAIDVTTGSMRKLDTYSFPAWAGGVVLPGY